MLDVLFDHLFWALGPLALVAGGLVAVRWWRVVREQLASLAARRGGRLVRGPWFLPPRAEWRAGDTTLTVSVRGQSGTQERGSRVFAHVPLERGAPFELELRRAESWGRDGEPLGTRDAEFERAFRATTDDARRARELLDGELRRWLLGFDAKHDVALRLGTMSAYRDGLYHHGEHVWRLDVSLRGLPRRIDVLEDLLRLARAAHERLARATARRAA